MKKMDHIETTYIEIDRDIDTNIPNIKCVSVWWWLWAISNSKGTFGAEFIE